VLSVLSREARRALLLTVLLAVLCGLVYPLAMTGLAQGLFHSQANGSLVVRNGAVIGSTLIGQDFTSPGYFHGRPSATVNASDPTRPQPYNAANSAGDNLAPSNQALITAVRQRVAELRRQNPTLTGDVPVDLVTTDFSGFDPDISEASALLQVNRVADARHLDPAAVRRLVESHVEGRSLGILGEPHVDVLALDLALDAGSTRDPCRGMSGCPQR
jgi:potassium-transporting ATPase KdpC subunit